MTAALRIDLGASNAFSAPMFKAYMGISASAPKGLQLEESEGELRLQCESELGAGEVSEVLKWLGASCTGNSPIRVLEPAAFAGQVAIPHESGGNKRWKCSRCERDVMQGVNDAGTVGGLCHDCWAVDMRLAGQPVPSLPPTPSAPPSVAAAAATHVAPSSPAPAPVAVVPTSPALFGVLLASTPSAGLVLELGPVLVVARARDLPSPATHRFAICAHRLAYSDGTTWRVLEGNVPPVE